MKNPLPVTKASGEIAPFSEEKLRNSLLRSGADLNNANAIISEIKPQLYPGISTKKIYQMTFKLLRNNARHFAARYHLKKAIMELGPSGFPFEKYIGEIFRNQNYTITIGSIEEGKCVKHEIDVIAKKENKKLLVECKYHNQPGIFSDVKIPLYIHSRFIDVTAEWTKKNPVQEIYEGWVVTNTKFSVDAIQYGTCAGLRLMGWDYPANASLKNLVDKFKLYPITCLTALTKSEKEFLLGKKVVLARELNENLLIEAGIKHTRFPVIMQEKHQLCEEVSQNKPVYAD
jgi:hypothetical protein